MDFGVKKMYIGGRLCESVAGTQKEIISPATGECIAKLCVASKEDTELALQEAQKGFENCLCPKETSGLPNCVMPLSHIKTNFIML